MAIKKIPCGGFYVDDGAVQNVDGKPVLSAWNADLPKPSVGGYGYTEQGNQTVITWDGDTEGKTAVVWSDNKTLYKVSDNASNANAYIGGSLVNGGDTFDIINEEEYIIVDGNALLVDAFAVIVTNAPFTYDGHTFEETGTYFASIVFQGNIYNTTSLTYGTPDTIHKIDEKYLPEGGFGWTEQGEQTVIVDNESITTVATSGMNLGEFATPFDIVDGAYTVIFNGTEYNLNSTFIEKYGSYIIGEVTESGLDFSRYPFMIDSLGEEAWLYTESAGDYEVTVKTTTEAIHKIDEKYLPASGGSTFFYVDDTNTDGYLDDNTLYMDEDRTIEATLKDIQASVGTVVQLIATSGKIYTPVECRATSSEYGFVVIQTNGSGGPLKPFNFVKETK